MIHLILRASAPTIPMPTHIKDVDKTCAKWFSHHQSQLHLSSYIDISVNDLLGCREGEHELSQATEPSENDGSR